MAVIRSNDGVGVPGRRSADSACDVSSREAWHCWRAMPQHLLHRRSFEREQDMGRIRLFVVAIVGGVAITALSIPAADAKTFCPPSPAPGSSISGGLVVTGPTDCVLDNVAVSGGI